MDCLLDHNSLGLIPMFYLRQYILNHNKIHLIIVQKNSIATSVSILSPIKDKRYLTHWFQGKFKW